MENTSSGYACVCGAVDDLLQEVALKKHLNNWRALGPPSKVVRHQVLMLWPSLVMASIFIWLHAVRVQPCPGSITSLRWTILPAGFWREPGSVNPTPAHTFMPASHRVARRGGEKEARVSTAAFRSFFFSPHTDNLMQHSECVPAERLFKHTHSFFFLYLFDFIPVTRPALIGDASPEFQPVRSVRFDFSYPLNQAGLCCFHCGALSRPRCAHSCRLSDTANTSTTAPVSPSTAYTPCLHNRCCCSVPSPCDSQ